MTRVADSADADRCGVLAEADDGSPRTLRAAVGWSAPDELPADGLRATIGREDDPWGVLVAATDDADPDADAFVEAVATVLTLAVERRRRRRETTARHELQATLNSLHDAVSEVTDAIVAQSTREEIEETVCELLADSEAYKFAWIGAVDEPSQEVHVRTEAGVEGYLDGLTLSVDPDHPFDGGPTADALRTGTVQVTNDARSDPRFSPVRDRVNAYDFRSSAAIPIAHEGTTYGVLNVYAGREGAFRSRERAVIARLGEIVGHVIAASERKRALLSDDLVELTLRIDDLFVALDTSVDPEGWFSFDHMVPVDDGDFIVYGRATEEAVPFLRDLERVNPEWESVTVRSEGSPARYELHGVDLPVFSAIASQGGYFEDVVIEDGDLRMTLYLSPSVDVHSVLESLRHNYPQTEIRSRRQFTRSFEDVVRIRRRIVTDLTDRQRATLEAAFYAGYFEWPRDADGGAVADSMGVSPPTFHQHLRTAQRKVLQAVLSSPTVGPE
ncbi:bacterio-opsin activator domain-containing protein [Halobaculum litoreum]|uniref:Bacterio-opsin activator domain-containing protein n=1 Tax=Halobaculum litoreum TaxID=3031998 RepID=A0ABD5XWX5_9EURY